MRVSRLLKSRRIDALVVLSTLVALAQSVPALAQFAPAVNTKPFGGIDTPTQGETISGNAYVNFGWALTPLPMAIAADGSTIQVYIDGTLVGPVAYNQYRSDIASLFPGLANTVPPIGYRVKGAF